ncbi:MAG: hypothetical protein ACRDN9_11325 [Streptosporangiaceae bacterium]
MQNHLDHLDPNDTLAEAERLRRAVDDSSSRWYIRYLVLIGVAILVMFPLFALPAPWRWVAFGVVWGGGMVGFGLYERGQQIRRHRSQRRVGVAFVGYFALVAALAAIGIWVIDRPPEWWWFPVAGAVFSLPFFVAAYLEHRTVGESWGKAGR